MEHATPSPTIRLYWQDEHCYETDAEVVSVGEASMAFSQTCFYPGGGGQPADAGTVTLSDGQVLAVTTVAADAHGVFWHHVNPQPAQEVCGQTVRLAIDRKRRLALTRYHTVLHVLNTIALRDYEAWITGVQIAVDYSRIDFKWEGFSPAQCKELETKVNAVLERVHPIKSFYLREEEFRQRPDLLRTLEVSPPVIDGRVRVVEIEGFDAQACGGTHMGTTGEVGRLSIFRTENKGRINKRLYVRLD